MKNIKIDTNEVQRILFLHENYKNTLLTEQSKEKTREEVLKWFADAKRAGCLKDPNLNYNSVFKTKSDDGVFKYFIKGPSNSMQGKIKRVYDDYTVEIVDPTTGNALRSSRWECKTTPQVAPKVTEPLNSNQNEVLRRIKLLGWFHEPAPTEFEIEMNNFEQKDLTKAGTELGLNPEINYSTWFTKEKFPNGFLVYKKTTTRTQSAGPVTKIEVDAKQCITAIEGLWNNYKNPRSYPITPEQRNDFRETAKMCAEPTNRPKFTFRPGLNNKLNDLGYR
jgi:hypothetical protein